MLLSGSRGAGKSELVRATTGHLKHKIIIDCDELINQRKDSDVIKSLAKQVGYFPLLNFGNMANLMELLISTTTGAKANLSSSTASQIKTILEAVAIAIHKFKQEPPLSERRDTESKSGLESISQDIDKMVRWSFFKSSAEPSDDSTDTNALQTTSFDPDNLPLVIIDNYLARGKHQSNELWQILADWAAALVEDHACHVVFVSNNIAAHKPLSKGSVIDGVEHARKLVAARP